MAAKVWTSVFWTVGVCCVVSVAGGAAPVGRSVTITVPERGGAGRSGEYVNFGVPIPET